jgi:hypothetical protein
MVALLSISQKAPRSVTLCKAPRLWPGRLYTAVPELSELTGETPVLQKLLRAARRIAGGWGGVGVGVFLGLFVEDV